MSTVDFGVGEECLDEILKTVSFHTQFVTMHAYLAVIECAIHGQVMHVGIHDGRHLCFLYRADLAMREHDEDGDILLAAQTIDGCRASITTCRTDNSQMFPIASSLVLISADEEVLEEVAQEL